MCTALCGWGHYQLQGRFVVDTPEEFAEYLKRMQRIQFERSYENGSPSDEPLSPPAEPSTEVAAAT